MAQFGKALGSWLLFYTKYKVSISKFKKNLSNEIGTLGHPSTSHRQVQPLHQNTTKYAVAKVECKRIQVLYCPSWNACFDSVIYCGAHTLEHGSGNLASRQSERTAA